MLSPFGGWLDDSRKINDDEHLCLLSFFTSPLTIYTNRSSSLIDCYWMKMGAASHSIEPTWRVFFFRFCWTIPHIIGKPDDDDKWTPWSVMITPSGISASAITQERKCYARLSPTYNNINWQAGWKKRYVNQKMYYIVPSWETSNSFYFYFFVSPSFSKVFGMLFFLHIPSKSYYNFLDSQTAQRKKPSIIFDGISNHSNIFLNALLLIFFPNHNWMSELCPWFIIIFFCSY